MIRLPIFEHLSVAGYGLYPGTESSPGLTVDFQPGATLILGANGLGKSTLILLMFRMCTGPADIRRLPTGELGYRQLDIGEVNRADRRTFAMRVHDEAVNATALMKIRLGDRLFEVTRELRTLRLVMLRIDEEAFPPDEEQFQQAIINAAGLARFEDWLLLLRYLVFYFEERRSLVWDPTAQHQVLRFLFLSPEESAQWTDLERDFLKMDSHVRNLSAALSREETLLTTAEDPAAPGNVASLNDLNREQDLDKRSLNEAEERFTAADNERQSARLSALRAAEEAEAARRNLERSRLETLHQSFPSHAESAKYIIGYLLASSDCLVCGNNVPDVAQDLRNRIDAARCVICNSEHGAPAEQTSDTNIRSLYDNLQAAEDRHSEMLKRRTEAEEEYRNLLGLTARLKARIASRRAEIDAITRSLPAESTEVKSRRKEFAAMRATLEVHREELNQKRARHRAYMEQVTLKILQRREAVKASFESFAEDFLLESCSLVWANQRSRIGQSGEAVESGTFLVEMSGNDNQSLVRRSGAEQVSESQREFIDLAFRMALMNVAGLNGVGTLVIDAPESSLDAVFAPRAADVLMKFGVPEAGNRLIIASNLVDGQLMPTLVDLAGIESKHDSRVVDLFKIASPTAAIRTLRQEYMDALDHIFDGGRR
ncbi:AAA family ATPase [Actinoplanes xinjiangensis]|uniref:AAA family ATPase n=1 Tax=Actinoplanes xinjiangensis TaxID=512350 RepID=UPI0034321A6A